MSLLDEAMENFIVINKQVVDDGYGGTVTEWVEGATIKGALTIQDSTETEIAKSLGATSLYKLTVRKNVELDYHTVLKRVKNGLYYRLTNDADDNKTPNSATLNMRVYRAELFELPQ